MNIAGTSVSLGSSITAATLTANLIGTNVAFITSSNIGSQSVASASTCTGNAATATKLATARTIWGQSFNGTAAISGALTGVTNINNVITLNSTATTLSGTLGVTGATTLSSTLGVTGATTLSSTLNVTGNTTLSGKLGVTKATTLSSTLGVSGATTLSSTLSVGSNTTIGGNLVVVGDIAEGGGSGSGSVTAGSIVTVSPTYSSGLSIGSITVDGDTSSFYVPKATATTYGAVKPSKVRSSSITASTGGTTAGRYYGVEMDSNGKLFVNVPWTDTINSGGGSSGGGDYPSPIYHDLDSVNGYQLEVNNGDTFLSTSSTSLLLNFSNIRPYNVNAPCVIYIIKYVSKILNIQVFSKSGIKLINQSTYTQATSDMTAPALTGLMLV